MGYIFALLLASGELLSNHCSVQCIIDSLINFSLTVYNYNKLFVVLGER